jgi:SAM-dependent methyltransferase
MFKNLKNIFTSKTNLENTPNQETTVMNEQIPDIESVDLIDITNDVEVNLADNTKTEDAVNVIDNAKTEDVVNVVAETNTAKIPTYEELTSYNPANFIPDDRLINDPTVVGWLSVEEQELLFSALLLFYSPEQAILDVGCGRADLYGYCNKLFGTTIPYTGIDYNPNMLGIAKQKYDGVNVEAVDILNTDESKYDWVVGSGLFNLLDNEDMETYAKTVIQKMYNKCNIGMAFNLLTGVPEDMADEDVAQLVVHDPSEWLNYLITTYTKVLCRADYLSGDVTFIILK